MIIRDCRPARGYYGYGYSKKCFDHLIILTLFLFQVQYWTWIFLRSLQFSQVHTVLFLGMFKLLTRSNHEFRMSNLRIFTIFLTNQIVLMKETSTTFKQARLNLICLNFCKDSWNEIENSLSDQVNDFILPKNVALKLMLKQIGKIFMKFYGY